MADPPGYNERLFSGSGLRNYYHTARYDWLSSGLKRRGLTNPLKIVELGCFDAKTLRYLPSFPESYLGLDANWENGLDLARAAWGGRRPVRLIEALDPEPLRAEADGTFDVAVALETLEHIPTEVMREYLAELGRITRGYLFVSVPNEMGPVFLMKHLVKLARYGGGEPYTFRELVSATLRQPHKVERHEHKGFDYRELIRDISKHFDIEEVTGIASMGLSPPLSLTVGIVARSRQAH